MATVAEILENCGVTPRGRPLAKWLLIVASEAFALAPGDQTPFEVAAMATRIFSEVAGQLHLKTVKTSEIVGEILTKKI